MVASFQLPLLDDLDRVVNVAQVTHRSPLRYPGGKTWLVPRVRQWLLSRPQTPSHLVEPFCGGAIVGLTAAFEGLAAHVTLIERDDDVASLWETIIQDDGGAAWLAHRLLGFELTTEHLDELLATPPATRREQAFQTLVRNRTNRGGILAPGAGRVKTGEGGRGLASRWYPETLARRIHDIAALRHRLTFVAGDGMQAIRDHTTDAQTLFFVDPPYTAGGKRAGNRLYTHSDLDHEALFASLREVAGDFLMSYDQSDEVEALATQHGLDRRRVAMKNTHHATMSELLISRDLSWLER